MKEIILDFLIDEYSNDDEFDYNTKFISEGYIDSLTLVSLLIFLENRFSIKIPPKIVVDIKNFDTVNSIINVIEQIQNDTF